MNNFKNKYLKYKKKYLKLKELRGGVNQVSKFLASETPESKERVLTTLLSLNRINTDINCDLPPRFLNHCGKKPYEQCKIITDFDQNKKCVNRLQPLTNDLALEITDKLPTKKDLLRKKLDKIRTDFYKNNGDITNVLLGMSEKFIDLTNDKLVVDLLTLKINEFELICSLIHNNKKLETIYLFRSNNPESMSAEDIKLFNQSCDSDYLMELLFNNKLPPSLKSLILSDTQIVDISRLKGSLPGSLTSLDLSDNKIVDISALKGSLPTGLKYLNLSYNQIVDISPLKGSLPLGLINLELGNNKIVDISPLKDSLPTGLGNLELDDNKIVDISPLKDSLPTGLKYLKLSFNQIVDISPLKDSLPTGLSILDLNNNQIVDILPLKGSLPTNLYSLHLSENQIVDISSLKDSLPEGLHRLDLSYNQIVDISPLKDNLPEGLNRLDLVGNAHHTTI